MSQFNAGASRFGKRLFKSAPTFAFALAAIAGGVVVSGGEAYANTITYTDSVLGIDFTDTLTVLKHLGTHDLAGAAGADAVEHLNETGVDYPNFQKTIDVNGDPAGFIGNNGQNNPNFNLNNYTGIYQMVKTGVISGTSNPVPVWFDKVGLSWISANPADFVTKTVCSAIFDSNGNCTGVTLATLNTNGSTALLPNTYSTIYIKDVVTGQGVTHLNNDLRDVPGPLPILGAGAAFGFSRKLRGRIKAVHTV